jgi:hypothetical protein
MNVDEPAAQIPFRVVCASTLARTGCRRTRVDRANEYLPLAFDRVVANRREPRQRITVRWPRHAPFGDLTRPPIRVRESLRNETREVNTGLDPGVPVGGPTTPGGGGVADVEAVQLTMPVSQAGLEPVAAS